MWRWIALACLLAASPGGDAASSESVLLGFDFERAGETEGWRANGHLAGVRVAEGVLAARGAGSDPIFELETRLDLPVTPWQVVEVRLKADRDGQAELFWGNSDRGRYGGFSQDKSLRFPVSGDGTFHRYRLRPFWHPEGRLVRLRLDLYDGAAFELDSLRVLEPVVAAAWDLPEFEFPRDAAGWSGGGGEGAVAQTSTGGLVVEVGGGDARIFAPPLGFEAAQRSFVTLRMAVDRGRRGAVFFAVAEVAGLHSFSFPVRADGREHTYNLDLLASAAWRGRVIALGLQPSDEPGARAVVRSLGAFAGPGGPPELEPVLFEVDDVGPRVGRPVSLVARVTNSGGGTASNLVATVELRAGLQLLPGERRVTRDALGFGEETEWRWQVTGEKPGRYRVVVEVGAAGIPSVRRELELELGEPVDPGSRELPPPRPVRGPFEVGVYYFPGWRTASQWHPIRRFPERRPALGWYREGEPEVADWHIRWAVEHGITFFAYDWYWSRGTRQLEHALHEGYFRAKYRSLLKFCLLWANHNAPGTSSLEDCLAVTRFWIGNYFHRPEHLQVDGRPVVILFSPDRLTADLGSEGVRKAFTAMRAECRAAGLGGLYLVACVPDAGVARQCAMEGYDAVTAYNWPHLGVPEGRLYAPFETLLEGYRRNWAHLADTAGIPLLPPICGGWDSRPWHGENQLVRFGRTPELFRSHLRDARTFLESRTGGGTGRVSAPPATGVASAVAASTPAGTGSTGGVRPLVLIEAWNEFGEGSYIEPHREYGFGYLDAVREVFGGDAAGAPHRDLVPADFGQGPYDVAVPEAARVAWTFDRDDEGWSNVMDQGDVRLGDGVLSGRSTGNDPAWFGPATQARAAEYSRVVLRLRLTALDGVAFEDRAQLFWRTATLSESEATSVRFPVAVDGAWHEYLVPVADNPRWRGVVTRLRLDPVNRRDVRLELDGIRLAP